MPSTSVTGGPFTSSPADRNALDQGSGDRQSLSTRSGGFISCSFRERGIGSWYVSLLAGTRANDTTVSSLMLCDHLATHMGTAVALGKLREVTHLWLVLGCAVHGGPGARSGCWSRACSLLILSSLVLFLLFQLCLCLLP